MHRRLNDITQRFPASFDFKEWSTDDGLKYIRVYFLVNDILTYCDSPVDEFSQQKLIEKSYYTDQNTPDQPMSSESSGATQTSMQFSTDSDVQQSRDKTSGRDRKNFAQTKQMSPRNLLITNFPSIEDYIYDATTSKFIFTIGHNICHVNDTFDKNGEPLIPIKIETLLKKPKSHLLLNPADANLVAYRCDGDLWCLNLRNCCEVRLTDVRLMTRGIYEKGVQPVDQPVMSENGMRMNTPITSFDECGSPIMIGRPSHVIREEFRRQQAIWWQPVPQILDETIEHSILYEVTDQSQVDLVNISSWDGSIESHRFTKPGKTNATSQLKLITFRVCRKDGSIADIVHRDLIDDFKSIYPEYEYLLRVGWLNQDTIWVQLLNRRQTHTVLVLYSLTKPDMTQIIYEERNDLYWISAHDILYFLNGSKWNNQTLKAGSELDFFWSSEESGFRHLYYIKVKIGCGSVHPRVLLKKQLTEGSWEVSDREFWVDEALRLLYFCGLRDTPLEKHLYVLNYNECVRSRHSRDSKQNHEHIHNKRLKMLRLTELNYAQSTIAFNAKRTTYINIQSNISVPPYGFINQLVPTTSSTSKRDARRLPESKRISLLLVNSLNYSLNESIHLDNMKLIGSRPSIMYDCQADLLPGLAKPELFCCQMQNGDIIYGSVFKPEFMESGVRYPTILEIYGGPEVQSVSNSFVSLRQPLRHLLSSEGYVVVLIDCRGSGKRGLSFEAHTHHRLGQVEITDQIEVLKWLSKNTGYIDLNRVAVKGWSYGGYLALMALAQYPKIFKVAISGAPVTNWHLYDSAYTERFMGLPTENLDGYIKGNVLNYVHLFPDQ